MAVRVNRLNRACAYYPLYKLVFSPSEELGWFEKVMDDPDVRAWFGIRNAVRRPSRTTFDDIPVVESVEDMRR